MDDVHRVPAPAQVSDLLSGVVSLLSAGAGAIHFAVAPAHFEEYWVFGVFFLAIAWLQVVWAILVVRIPSRLLILFGALFNAGIVAVWVTSRTTGVPIGPEAGSPEEAQLIDVMSTVFEVLIVLAAPALALRRKGLRPIRRKTLIVSVLTVAISVMLLSSVAMVSSPPEEPEGGADLETREALEEGSGS